MVRKPIRHRVKTKKTQDRTAADKAGAIVRQQKKQELNGAIEEIISLIQEEFEKLAERFDKAHTSSWFFQQIMQCGKKSLDARKHSTWNAYMSKRIKEINDGE